MIKSHLLYRLSYAPVRAEIRPEPKRPAGRLQVFGSFANRIFSPFPLVRRISRLPKISPKPSLRVLNLVPLPQNIKKGLDMSSSQPPRTLPFLGNLRQRPCRVTGLALFAGLVACLSGLAASAGALAEDQGPVAPRTVAVEGTGRVQAVPDMVEVDLGVVTRDKSAEVALQANTAAANRVREVLREAGLDPQMIQTRDFAITPVYSEVPADRRGARSIEAYEVRNKVTLRTRKMDALGSLLTRLVAAGSNTVHGIRFGFSEPEKLLARAQEKAVLDARAKAKRYLNSIGEDIGKIREISERGTAIPMETRRLGASVMNADVPIEAGENEVSVTIWTVWDIN